MNAPRRRQPLSDLVCPPPVPPWQQACDRDREDFRAWLEQSQAETERLRAEHEARMAEHDVWMAQFCEDYARDRVRFREQQEQYRAETARIRAEHQYEKQEWELRHERRQREHEALLETGRTGDST